MSIKTPNIALNKAVALPTGSVGSEQKILPAGSYVKPIEYCYIPKHVLNAPQNKYFDQKLEIFVHTKYGIFRMFREHLSER